jgi:hypothetical protein
MSDLPRYRLWYPTLDEKGKVGPVILTRGTSSRAPLNPRSFFEALLDLAGITGELVAWRANPFICSYFSEGEWQECWEVKVILDGAKRLMRDSIAGVGVFEEAEEEESPERYMPVRVFADFTQHRDAVNCRGRTQGTRRWFRMG